jgi:hypothetical protein
MAATPESETSLDFPKWQVERWCAGCHSFLMWEREHILKGDPSAEQKESHRSSLKRILAMTRLIYAWVSDPDVFGIPTRAMVKLTVDQLDRSWRMIYEPLPEAEAEKRLAEIFPE